MSKDIFKNYAYPIAAMIGNIIGVGFLSLPYLALQVGIWPILFYVIILTFFVVILHVIFSQISLKTPDHKRFAGFVGFYLGNVAKTITLISLIIGSFGILIVYCIVGGQFLASMALPFFGGSVFWYSLGFFAAGSLLVYFGLKAIYRFEFWALVLLLVSFVIIFINEFSHLKLANIFFTQPLIGADWKTLFLPYGIIIFSLWGVGFIPMVEEMLTGTKQLLKRVVIISTVGTAVMYVLFIFLILGISGVRTSQSALTGLQGFLGQGLFSIALSIGIISTFIAFVTQGLYLKETLIYDVRVKPFPAWLVTCFVPLILFLLGFNSFIGLMSFIGGVLLGINGMLILLMYKKIGGKNRVLYPLALVFVLGIVYEIVYFVK